MAGPGEEMAAGAGRGRLRASRADREHVIETLKAAFVQGLLGKDEFEARVGQTLTARTYAELATLTACIPAGLPEGLPPRELAPVQAYPPMDRAAKCVAGACAIIPPALLAVAFLVQSEGLFRLIFPVMIVYFMGWVVAGVQMLDTCYRRRSRRQPSQRPAPGQRGDSVQRTIH